MEVAYGWEEKMTDADFVLGHDQRDEIMKAVTAIRRQLTNIGDKPHWQAFWVWGDADTAIHERMNPAVLFPTSHGTSEKTASCAVYAHPNRSSCRSPAIPRRKSKISFECTADGGAFCER